MDLKNRIEDYKENIVQDVVNLIRIRSTREEGSPGMPFGLGMKEALDYVLTRAEEMGFRVRNLDGYCGYAEYGEGDLYIGILSHVDTCPEGEMWAVPPFEGKIINNRIYGRGSMDNKGPLIAALYALLLFKETGIPSRKKIRLIIGTDEERYYEDMAHYLEMEKPPIAGFTLDGQFPVVFAEKGLSMVEFQGNFSQNGSDTLIYLRGGTSENTVPGHCEAFIKTDEKSRLVKELSRFAKENRHNMTARMTDGGVILEATGVETHSMALEMGINAISPMIRFLSSLGTLEGDVQNMLSFLDKKIGFELYGQSLGVAWEDEFSGKLTLNLGTINFYQGEMAVRLDFRYPVTCDFVAVSRTLHDQFTMNGFARTENSFWDPIYFPKEHFLITALLDAYRDVTGDTSEPIFSGSGSYSKVMPNVAAFGAIFPGESMAWHRVNEYIDLENLYKMTEIYATAIEKLANNL